MMPRITSNNVVPTGCILILFVAMAATMANEWETKLGAWSLRIDLLILITRETIFRCCAVPTFVDVDDDDFHAAELAQGKHCLASYLCILLAALLPLRTLHQREERVPAELRQVRHVKGGASGQHHHMAQRAVGHVAPQHGVLTSELLAESALHSIGEPKITLLLDLVKHDIHAHTLDHSLFHQQDGNQMCRCSFVETRTI